LGPRRFMSSPISEISLSSFRIGSRLQKPFPVRSCNIHHRLHRITHPADLGTRFLRSFQGIVLGSASFSATSLGPRHVDQHGGDYDVEYHGSRDDGVKQDLPGIEF